MNSEDSLDRNVFYNWLKLLSSLSLRQQINLLGAVIMPWIFLAFVKVGFLLSGLKLSKVVSLLTPILFWYGVEFWLLGIIYPLETVKRLDWSESRRFWIKNAFRYTAIKLVFGIVGVGLLVCLLFIVSRVMPSNLDSDTLIETSILGKLYFAGIGYGFFFISIGIPAMLVCYVLYWERPIFAGMGEAMRIIMKKWYRFLYGQIAMVVGDYISRMPAFGLVFAIPLFYLTYREEMGKPKA